MDGNFDILTMSYQAPPLPQSNVPHLDTGLLPLDGLDHTSNNFDNETFAGSEDVFSQHGMGPMPPQLRRYPSTYEDPFSDVLSSYDQHMAPDQGAMEGPSVERGHKLLSFSMPNYSFHILDFAYRRTTLSLTAQLHGMFFLAESPWASTSDAANQPTELTCYRRNLFQISGTLMLPRGLRYIVTEQNEQLPILSQELAISATESVEGNPVKIISVPWKTPAAGAPVVEDKTEKEPPPISLDLMNGQDVDEAFVTFPISWKRLQFRIATANNGRRKELQQHFIIHLKLMVTLANGVRVAVCEVMSGAIIVRGRSPRNFQSRKDIAISQSGGNVRNRSANHTSGNHQPAQPSRASNAGSGVSIPKQEPNSAPLEMPPNPFNYDPSDIQVSPDFFEWKIPGGANHTGALTALPDYAVNLSPQGAGPGGGYAQSSPDLTRVLPPRSTPAAPINLSLTDDEPVKKASASPSDSHRAKKTPQAPIPRPPSFSLGLISSPDESSELLYEYFPLSLNDWMPPVDAVYRPHVVHHMTVPGDIKSDRGKGRSKRYFSEDQPA